jgi:hypothetical protein
MTINILRGSRWWVILILLVSAGVFFFFFRMYQADIKALRNFMASYKRFDKAIDFYTDRARTSAALDYAGEAVIELEARASLRLSSLIRNDAELMGLAREVADLSRKELDSLWAFDTLTKSRNPSRDEVAKEEELDKEIGVLRGNRKAACARFRELVGKRSNP